MPQQHGRFDGSGLDNDLLDLLPRRKEPRMHWTCLLCIRRWPCCETAVPHLPWGLDLTQPLTDLC
ncbi:MAG: hypothetical protein IPJ36_04925 [Simplicispira sp.]|nr:hypothetical protein [Simplicispira sp.]